MGSVCGVGIQFSNLFKKGKLYALRLEDHLAQPQIPYLTYPHQSSCQVKRVFMNTDDFSDSSYSGLPLGSPPILGPF